jgi:prevent-host-death family protein
MSDRPRSFLGLCRIALEPDARGMARKLVKAGRRLDQQGRRPYALAMARQVNLYEAKTNLSQLVEDAAAGEEIVIAKNGKAKARLVAVAVPEGKPKTRAFGQWATYLTAEELNDLGSPEWWRRWKEADAEIERDFYEGMEEDWKEYDAQWSTTSSTPTPSSGRKQVRKTSGGKRSKRSAKRKTGSS